MSDSLLLYCRFCAKQKHSTEITNLKTRPEKLDEIIEKLSVFITNPVEFHLKHLPDTICNQCFESLSNSHEFFYKIKSSQTVLLNLVPRDIKGELEESKIYIDDKKDGEFIEITVKHEREYFEDNHFSDFDTNDDDSKPLITWATFPCSCKHCGMKVEGINALREHVKRDHEKCNGFKCAECCAEFDMFNEFIAHVKGHIRSLKDVCEYCNIKLEDTQQHLKHHTTQQICQECGETFSNKRALQSHIKAYSPKKDVKQRLTGIKQGATGRKQRATGRKRGVAGIKQEVTRKKMDSKVIFNNDLNIKSWADYPWICRFCSIKLDDQQSLRDHVKAHGRCFGVKCSDCNDNYIKTFSKFVEHVISHRTVLKSYCPYCNFNLSTDNGTHLDTHKTELQCSICEETFHDAPSLAAHTDTYKMYRSKKIYTQEDLTCKICHKVSKSATNLHDHMKVHEERTRDFSCDRCGMSFYTKGNLKNHIIIHENPDPQICKICNKSFLTLIRLRKHLVSHNSDKPFECPECNRRFRIKKYLKSHMITHGSDMPFRCQYCDKAFRFKGVLKVHERQHTGTRPYFCDICNRDFFSWSNCDKHLRRMHGVTLAKSKLTPEGRIPINPKSLKPKRLEIEDAKEWSEQVMVHRKRGKKSAKSETEDKISKVVSDTT